MKAEVASAKKAITEAKPLEYQIKSCHEALQRHECRLEAARAKLAAASVEIEREESEVASLLRNPLRSWLP